MTTTNTGESRGSHSERKAEDLTLSPKPFSDFTASEFRTYVKSLYGVRTKRSSKKPSNGLTFRVNGRGTLILTCRREWKWITEVELESLSVSHSVPLNQLWIYVKERGFTICASEAEAQSIRKAHEEIPW